MPEHENDFLASEIFSELKAANERAHEQLLRERKYNLIEKLVFAFVIVAVVTGFLFYLYQYDFVSYETHTAEGVYAIVDSDGNVVAADLTEDQLQQLIGGSYGDSESDNSEGTQEEEVWEE